MEDEKVAEATETQEGAEAAQPMSLEELIAQAQTAGTEKLEVVENRGKDSGKKPKSDGPQGDHRRSVRRCTGAGR